MVVSQSQVPPVVQQVMYLFLDCLMFQLLEIPIPLTMDILMVHPMEHLMELLMDIRMDFTMEKTINHMGMGVIVDSI